MFDHKLLESSELYDKRYRNFATLLVLPLSGLFIFLVLFSLVGNLQLTVQGVGSIEPIQVIAQIQSTSNQPILENQLREGKLIKPGDRLLTYEGQSDKAQLKALSDQLDQTKEQKRQLSILEASLSSGHNQFDPPDHFGYYQQFQNYLGQVQNAKAMTDKSNQSVSDQNRAVVKQSKAIQDQLQILGRSLMDYKKLQAAVIDFTALDGGNQFQVLYDSYLNQIAASPTQKMEVQNQFVTNIQSNIDQLQSQIQSLFTQAAGLSGSQAYDYSFSSNAQILQSQALGQASQEMVTLDTSILDLEAKVALQSQADQNNIISSHQAGVLHLEKGVKGQSRIPVGTLIAEIFPLLESGKGEQGVSVQVSTFVTASVISGLHVGQKLRFTAQQNLSHPLILSGKVNQIDDGPTIRGKVSMYEVKAQIKISSQNLPKIRYGLQGKSVIVTGEKTYFNYIKDKIMGND